MVYENRARKNCHPNERKWPIIWTIPRNVVVATERTHMVERSPITLRRRSQPLENDTRFFLSAQSMVKHFQFNRDRCKNIRIGKIAENSTLAIVYRILPLEKKRTISRNSPHCISRDEPLSIRFLIGDSSVLFFFFFYSHSNFDKLTDLRLSITDMPVLTNYPRGWYQWVKASRGFHNAETLERARSRG